MMEDTKETTDTQLPITEGFMQLNFFLKKKTLLFLVLFVLECCYYYHDNKLK